MRSVRLADASDFESRLQTPTDRPTGVYRSEPSLQDAFKRVVDRVRSDGSQLFGAYIVESVAEAEFGTAVRALAAMGVDPLVVRQAATEEIDRINKR